MTGGLHGIMRVRGFTQDDGHIFCTEDQILEECAAFTTLLQQVYKDFGFTDIIYKVATRPEKRIGSDEVWDKAEQALMESLRATSSEFTIAPGDGAFYGPNGEEAGGGFRIVGGKPDERVDIVGAFVGKK